MIRAFLTAALAAVILTAVLISVGVGYSHVDTGIAAPTAASQAIELCFTTGGNTSPGDDCAGRVAVEIGRARQSVDVFAYDFTERRIAATLVAVFQSGVAVRILADSGAITERGGVLLTLRGKNLPIYIDGAAGLQHNKVMIIDGHTVLTGSLNWTVAANQRNAENLLIIKDRVIAGQYEANFLARLAGATAWR